MDLDRTRNLDRKRKTARSPEHAGFVMDEIAASSSEQPGPALRKDRGEIIEIRTGDVLPSGGPAAPRE